ncbi:MAG: D-aminoacyl-tRNA deacylase, partial [Candidatus Binataceae bacterium]
MRAVVQRVSRARVTVGARVTGEIRAGLLVLLGVAAGDSADDAAYIADRIIGMRIFRDGAGKMNLALGAAGGALLVV